MILPSEHDLTKRNIDPKVMKYLQERKEIPFEERKSEKPFYPPMTPQDLYHAKVKLYREVNLRAQTAEWLATFYPEEVQQESISDVLFNNYYKDFTSVFGKSVRAVYANYNSLIKGSVRNIDDLDEKFGNQLENIGSSWNVGNGKQESYEEILNLVYHELQLRSWRGALQQLFMDPKSSDYMTPDGGDGSALLEAVDYCLGTFQVSVILNVYGNSIFLPSVMSRPRNAWSDREKDIDKGIKKIIEYMGHHELLVLDKDSGCDCKSSWSVFSNKYIYDCHCPADSNCYKERYKFNVKELGDAFGTNNGKMPKTVLCSSTWVPSEPTEENPVVVGNGSDSGVGDKNEN